MSSAKQISLRFAKFSSFIEEFSGRLALSGAQVKAAEPIEPGTEVELELQLVDGFLLLSARGHVAWAHQKATGDTEHAIRFSSLDPKSRELVLKILEEQVRSGGEPFDIDLVPDGAEVEEAVLESPTAREETLAPTDEVVETPEPEFAEEAVALDAPWGDALPDISPEMIDDPLATGDETDPMLATEVPRLSGLQADLTFPVESEEEASISTLSESTESEDGRGEPQPIDTAFDPSDFEEGESSFAEVEEAASEIEELPELGESEDGGFGFGLPTETETEPDFSVGSADEESVESAIGSEDPTIFSAGSGFRSSEDTLESQEPSSGSGTDIRSPDVTTVSSGEEQDESPPQSFLPSIDSVDEETRSPLAGSEKSEEVESRTEQQSRNEAAFEDSAGLHGAGDEGDSTNWVEQDGGEVEREAATAFDPQEFDQAESKPTPSSGLAALRTPEVSPDADQPFDEEDSEEPDSSNQTSSRKWSMLALTGLTIAVLVFLFRGTLSELVFGPPVPVEPQSPAADSTAEAEAAFRVAEQQQADQVVAEKDSSTQEPPGPEIHVVEPGTEPAAVEKSGPERSSRPQDRVVTEPSTAAAADSTPSAAAVPSDPAPMAALQRATILENITWREVEGRSEFELRFNGEIEARHYSDYRLRGASDRVLIKIRGIGSPYPQSKVEVGTPAVQRIRSALHQKEGGPELHLVFDLPNPALEIVSIQVRENLLLLVLGVE